MNSSYPRSDRPSLQRRPLTAPAPIRPLSSATGTATTAATVSKPHPLRRAVSHSTGPVEDEAEEGSEDDAAAAAEELREIVANLSLRQQLRRPLPDITDTGTTLPNQTESRPTAAAAALRKSSPPSSLLYMSRALPRTPSRGSRNGGVGVPLKRKASHGGSGGTGIPLSVPESVPMQVDTAAGAAAAGDELCADAKLGRRRDTPPWIGLDGKRHSPPSRAMTRNPFLRQTTTSTITSSSALSALPPHPQIVRAATEPVLPLPPPSTSTIKSSTKT